MLQVQGRGVHEPLLKAGLNYPDHDDDMGYGLLDAYEAVKKETPPPFEMEEVKIFAGYRSGSTIYVYSDEANPFYRHSYGRYEYDLYEIDPGSWRVFAWYDVDGTGSISKGDYYMETSHRTFEAGASRRVDIEGGNWGIRSLMQVQDDKSIEILKPGEFDKEEILRKIEEEWE